MQRKLNDRIETYESETNGNCKCGREFIRINGSNCTCNTDNTRYVYPANILHPACIFSCEQCGEPIMDNFIAS